MQEKIRINFKHFWPGFDKWNNFFTNLLKEQYSVEIDPNPRIMFFSVFGEDTFLKKQIKNMSNITTSILPKATDSLKRKIYRNVSFKMPNINGNYVKVFYTSENVIPEMRKCDWAFSYEYDEDFKHPAHLRLPYYVFCSTNFGQELVKTHAGIDKIKKQKRKFCNFIYSAKNAFREDFYKRLTSYKKIDAPGASMNNAPPIGNNPSFNDSRNSINWMDQKIRFLQNYKFTIAFENASRRGYTTEKIYNAMLAGTIPPYFGNPSIHREFNPKSFLNFSDFKSTEDFIETIVQIDQDTELYKRYLEEPWFYKNKPSKYFDKEILLERLSKIIDNK